MSICRGCGGVVGRDCFNPPECEWIADDIRRRENESASDAARTLAAENADLRAKLAALSDEAAPGGLSPPAFDGSHVGIEDRPDMWPEWVHRVTDRAYTDGYTTATSTGGLRNRSNLFLRSRRLPSLHRSIEGALTMRDPSEVIAEVVAEIRLYADDDPYAGKLHRMAHHWADRLEALPAATPPAGAVAWAMRSPRGTICEVVFTTEERDGYLSVGWSVETALYDRPKPASADVAGLLREIRSIIARPPRDIPASCASDFERDGRDLAALYPRIDAALKEKPNG